MTDKIKLGVAALSVVAGLVGFYVFAEGAVVVRILLVLAGLGLGLAIAWKTELGQRVVQFSEEAVVEVRKVVWPSRKETIQTTVAVFGFVLLMAVVLYFTDKTLEWVMYDLILGWRK